ncbi:MAG: hypothetical protein M1818_004281 [Claussenomyces sp. TS43310]|nr:MAG: hypothetical protein M1818_004281 [Claussenomyces sp. TS43310]
MDSPPSTAHGLHLFPTLPVEIRLKIWRDCLSPRICEIQLTPPPALAAVPPANLAHSQREALGLLASTFKLVSIPSLPAILHVCSESRCEALAQYRSMAGTSFQGPRRFPFNLYHPSRDTLFLARSLYGIQAVELHFLHSGPAAAVAMGVPAKEFVLDRLASNPADVELVEKLAVLWSDMHVQDVESLMPRLRLWKRLRVLYLVFFEMRDDGLEVRLLGGRRKTFGRVEFLEARQSTVRGRFLERMLEESLLLAEALTATLKEVEVEERRQGRNEWIAPTVEVKLARFDLG